MSNLNMYTKSIAYDRETHDYAMYLDSELVGFARSYHDAEVTLDQLVFELLSGRQPQPTLPTQRTAQERLTLFSEAFRAAKREGRDLDASRYQAEALNALAEALGITVEQMLAEQRAMKTEAA